MNWLRSVPMRLRALVDRNTVEQELNEELRFHLEMQTEENIRRGMSPREARRQALLLFGGMEGHKEACRDARGVRLLENTASDVRFAARALRKSPGSTAIAVLALALGIGATTAVFSLANWILLRPVPGVIAPKELVTIEFVRGETDDTGISYPNIVDLQGAAPALSGLAAYETISLQAFAEGGSVLLEGEAVAGDYFGVLGLHPERGRLFLPDELAPTTTARVAVISSRLWRSLFAASPNVVGKRLRLNGSDFTVVGVAPEGFHGIERVGTTDVWLPAAMYPLLRHKPEWSAADRGRHLFDGIFGRLRPGTSATIAEVQLRRETERLVESFPEDNEKFSIFVPSVFPGIGVPVFWRKRITAIIGLLLGIVFVVLLIACANVANVLLFRGIGRRGELAVRRALGASMGRLLGQHLAEGIFISVIGGVGGVLFALGLTGLFRGQRSLRLAPTQSIGMDWRVLGFALVLTMGTGLLLGVLPAIAARREDFLAHLKESSRTDTARGSWLRSGLMTVQIAASMVLLVGALLLTRTLHNLNQVELGFDANGVLGFRVSPEPQGYSEERDRLLRSQLLERVRAVPGIHSVSLTPSAPFSRSLHGVRLLPGDQPDGVPPLEAHVYHISPDFFTSLRIPFLAGRSFTQAEVTASPKAAREGGIVISRSVAQRLFGEENPLGRRVIEDGYQESFTYTVIGMVGDIRTHDLRAGPDLVVYRPLAAAWPGSVQILVRSDRPRTDTERAVRAIVAEIDPFLPVFDVETLSESVARYMNEERLFARMLGLLAFLAAFFAATGLYGLVSYSVAQRTREIGIRMALGAHAASVVRLVARQSVRIVGAGCLIGVVAAVALSRSLESLLFGVESLDSRIYLAAGAAFLAIALAATAAPARSATRVNPVDALRSE